MTCSEAHAAINAAADTIEREFAAVGDWSAQVRHLMELGRTLPRLADSERTEAHRVHGCQSQLWAVIASEGSRLRLRADSDAMIMRGALSLVVRLFDNRPSAVVAECLRGGTGQPAILAKLAPSRTNGLRALLSRVEEAACASCTGAEA